MRLTLFRPAFMPLLTLAQRVLPRTPVLDILAYAELRVDAADASLRVTDLDHTLTQRLPLAHPAEGEGVWLLPLARLTALVRSLEADDLTLTLEDRHCRLRAGRTRATLTLADPVQYPATPPMEACVLCQADTPALALALRQTQYARGDSDHWESTNGLRLEADGLGTLTVRATDRHRLAQATCPLLGECPPWQGLLGTATVPLLGALLDQAPDLVALRITPEWLEIGWDAVGFQARLLAGAYPSFEEVIPASRLRGTVDTAAWLAALQACLAVVPKGMVWLAPEDARTLCVAAQGEAGEVCVPVPIEWHGTDWLAPCVVSGPYLHEALRALACPRVGLTMRDPLTPLRLEGVDGEGVLAVIMPANPDTCPRPAALDAQEVAHG